jgi:hypothetical protein
MHTTIKTQKVQKEGQDVLQLTLIEPLWVQEHLHIQFLWNKLWVVEVVDNVKKNDNHKKQ